MTQNEKKRLAAVRLLALDVDGVLTDGSINIGTEGELFKAFNVKDGLGISCALRSGLEVAVITGRRSAIIHRRCGELGITLLREGVTDKYLELLTLQTALGLTREETAYMGDDLNDLPAFAAAGVCLAPADAAEEVRCRADFVTAARGGRGAVREAVELLLKARGFWEGIVARYARGAGGLWGDRQ